MVAGIMAVATGKAIVGAILIFGGLIAYLFGIFSIRGAMEEYYSTRENIGLQLSGGMTFFSARSIFSTTSTSFTSGRRLAY